VNTHQMDGSGRRVPPGRNAWSVDCAELARTASCRLQQPGHGSQRAEHVRDGLLALEPVIKEPELRSAFTLSSDDFAPRRARAFTRDTLAEWGLYELSDRALLVVSELTTNARRHGRTRPENEAEDITLTLAAQDDVLGIVLQDNCSELPVPRAVQPSALDGRGLHIVSAEADVWSVRLNTDGTGKQVLVFLRCPPAAPAA
jgi:anti-sigma regulatory factor (Ser/Thr protein kinase)